MRGIEDIKKAIDAFVPTEGNWLKLDELIEELLKNPDAETGTSTLLHVLERFPEEDGGGVLWSIVHGLEHLDGYESALIESVQRQPSHLGLTMIRRIENTGQVKIAGRIIKEIYTQLLHHPKTPRMVKEDIEAYLY